ncbi:Coiled-coil domain-containing protein 87 [Holothuria leucospilota]|uniref:Coiled-coil domain-containing protein 87 n=1 Tax=Holothuria leucospilota TaxID=206669 RepID=A0A9Q1GZH3_HOLLE|nr:Coiled-coil domain-containing protein 87 [Holothuria leucospilota]
MASVPANHPREQRIGPTLYELEKTKYGSRQLEKQYEDILGPLSLFAPLPSEEVQEKDDIEEERPVTPIEESIKTPPSTFKQLAKLIRRRVAAKPGLEHLTQDEQQTLAGVIMGEVNCIWPDIRRQVDDPFLSPEENKELQRRITVHIVTVCEQLFHHYVEKAKVLNSRGVFSEQANISRLKAQLSLDANKFLNILAIRRYIVADIRGNLSESDEEDILEPVITKDTFVPLSYKKLIECSRPKRKHGYKKTVEQEIKDMDYQMPPIQPQKALEYMPDTELMERALEDFEEEKEENKEETELLIEEEKDDEIIDEEPEEEAVSQDQESIQDSIQFSGERSRELPRHRPDSLPELHKDSFMEDLGLEKPPGAGRPSSSIMIRKKVTLDNDVEIQLTVKPSNKPAPPDPKEVLKKDLEKLSVFTSMRDKARDEPMKEDEDLPPLLQAVDETERGETRREMLQRKMKEMEQERLKKEAAERYKVTKPSHPQPATVTTKLRDKSVVRTSDIRVSERVQQGRVSLQLYKTVFNELVDEIDANTIKRMDSNLFRGQEINEVYNEIIKTLPTDHHSFDKDDFVELCADPKALHKTPLLAAANLTANKPGRVINQELCSINEPPWGENRDVWCQSPIFNATFAQQNPSKPVQQASGATDDFNFSHGTNNYTIGGLAQSLSGAIGEDQGLGHGQALMDERNARSYASWLAWWKNTISSEDYIKYLSTQESDYLGVVFHFYDHDGVSSTDDKSETNEERLALLEKERERQEKLAQLREQKSHFTEGMWNVGTITLGGLGKDPELEEELEETSGSAVNSPSLQNIRRTHSGKVRLVRSVTSTPTDGTMLKVPGTGTSRNVSRTSIQRGRVEVISPSIGSPEIVAPTSQERLEAVWNSLQMPDHMRLDMAIKYSSNEYADKLIESLEAWEVATELILQREAILSNLEAFERFASDPDRFFHKGQRGSSVARLQEAKKRSSFYAGLQNLEGKTRRKIQFVEKKYQDVVTYQGRPYLDKMKVDCTEMLYWLQQERRQQALEHSAANREFNQITELPVAELPSVTATV